MQRIERKEFCWITWHTLSHLLSWHSPVVSLSTTGDLPDYTIPVFIPEWGFVIGCIWLKCPSYAPGLLSEWLIILRINAHFYFPSLIGWRYRRQSHIFDVGNEAWRGQPQRSHPDIPQVMPGASPLTPQDYISVGKASQHCPLAHCALAPLPTQEK